MAKAKRQKPTSLKQWAPVVGTWNSTNESTQFVVSEDAANPYGIALSSAHFKSGTVSLKVQLNHPRESAARVLFGYETESGAYFTAGIGGGHEAYVMDEFIPGRGWRALRAIGSNANLQKGRRYDITVTLEGQAARLSVDAIDVMEVVLPHPLLGD
jgi:hypothetical protein